MADVSGTARVRCGGGPIKPPVNVRTTTAGAAEAPSRSWNNRRALRVPTVPRSKARQKCHPLSTLRALSCRWAAAGVLGAFGILILPTCATAAKKANAGRYPGAVPDPSSSASPEASPTPRPLGFRAVTDAYLTFVDQTTAGPGQAPPEAAAFIAGLPLAPNTPYDLFFECASGSRRRRCDASDLGALVRFLRRYDVGLTVGFAYATGSVTNASYWTENLLPPLNPAPRIGGPSRIGSPFRRIPEGTMVPRRAAAVLSGSAATADGNLACAAAGRSGTKPIASCSPRPRSPA